MRSRKDILDEISKALTDFPSVIDSVKLDAILEVLLDIRALVRYELKLPPLKGEEATP